MTDKNGNTLKVGDDILIWWNGRIRTAKIRELCNALGYGNADLRLDYVNTYYHESHWSYAVEKLPDDQKEREQILLLRKLEQ
jgi:hypothetical protein